MTNEPSSIAQAIRPAPPKICTYELPLVRIVQETPDTFTYEFNLRSDQPFAYWPGQWAFLALKKPEGTAVKRAFSFSSTPTRPGTVAFTIKLLKGEFTALLEGLQPGAPFQVKGPFGEFGFKDSVPPSLVFIAGGVGITPFHSMIDHALKQPGWRVQLLYSNRNRKRTVHFEELRKLAEKKRNFRVIFTMTSQRGWTGERARINPSFIKRYVKSPKTKLFYLAGSPRMNYDITGALLRLSVPSKNIKTEDFTGY